MRSSPKRGLSMPSDTGPTNVDRTRAAISTNAQNIGRVDKPLGRGLEDVSHLFLSQRTGEPAAREQTWRPLPARGSSQPGTDAGSVLLQPRRSFAKDRLAAALREFDGALDEGMRRIDTNLPCDLCGEIDMIALDGVNQLAIIDFDTTPNDHLLLRGMGHFDWVMHNIANLRRMYPG